MKSSRKSSVSTAAPEVILTKPADKDIDGQSESPQEEEKKRTMGKSLLQLMPVRLFFISSSEENMPLYCLKEVSNININV